MSLKKPLLLILTVCVVAVFILFSSGYLSFDTNKNKSNENTTIQYNDNISTQKIDFPILGKWYLEIDTSNQYIFDEPTFANGEIFGLIDIIEENHSEGQLNFNFYPPSRIKISDPYNDFPPYEFEFQLSENNEVLDVTYLSEYSKGFVSRFIRNVSNQKITHSDFSGTWSNEGDVTSSSRLSIEIEQKSDEIEGTITFHSWDNNGDAQVQSGLCSIVGTIKNNVANITIYDGNGRKHAQGSLIIEKQQINFQLDSEIPFFPKKYKVWRQ